MAHSWREYHPNGKIIATTWTFTKRYDKVSIVLILKMDNLENIHILDQLVLLM